MNTCFKVIIAAFCLITTWAHATTIKRNAYIYRYPYQNAQKVDRVSVNQKAVIKGATGAFYKVKVFSKRYNQVIEGWVAKKAFVAVKNIAPVPQAPAQKTSRPVSRKKPYTPPRRPQAYAKAKKESALHISVGPGFSVLNYLIRSENNLPFYDYFSGGPGLSINANYALNQAQAIHHYSIHLSGSYYRLNTTVALKDDEGVGFLETKIKQSILTIHPSLHYLNQAKKNYQWGLDFGYHRVSFNSDDIQTLTQQSQNVFNAYSNKQFTLGLAFIKPIQDQPLKLYIKYAFANRYKDKSDNLIFNDVSLKLGLLAGLHYDYVFKQQHTLSLNYGLSYQQFESTGSFDLAEDSYSNSQFEYLQHQLSIEYKKSF